APAIGGFLGEINLRLPFWIAVVLCLANFVYGWFVLPESLPKEKRTAHFDWSHANPLGALILLRRYPQVLGLVGVLFLMALAHMVYPTTFVLYADYRFHWGPQMVGYTLALVGALSAVVQGGLIKKIVGWLGERRALLFGLSCGTVGFLLYGLAPTGWWFWLAIPVATFWGVANPAAQAIITHQVDPHEQGRLQGAIASLSSIAGMIAPTLFTRLFAAVTQGQWHDIRVGATFFLASAIVGSGLLLALRVTARMPSTKELPPAVAAAAEISEAAASAELQPPVGEPPHA
ncbi:MAG: MFS transporter, partial [Rudaea sp.]